MKETIWTHNIQNKVLPSLKENTNCDILIIGGGMAGLSTAYFLKDSNKKIILIDRNKCALGASSKNTGKLSWSQDLVYHKIEKNYNTKTALNYLNSQKEAISIIEKIVKENNISCHLEKVKDYIFSNDSSEEDKFNKEMTFFKNNHIKYQFSSSLPINYPSKYALVLDDNYTFNPYEYLVGLKNFLKDKIKIFENTTCTKVDKRGDGYLITTNDGYTIKCNVVIVASHYPMFVLPFLTPFKTEVQKFYLVCGKTNDYKDVTAITSSTPTVSMRYYRSDKNNYLIYGRNSHSITSNLDVRDDYQEIKSEYRKYFHNDIDYYFQNHDLMTYDNLPFIGKIDNQNLYIATGFNKWGNTNGTIAGKVLSELILEEKSAYQEIFNPHRSLSLDKIVNLTKYNFDVGYRYIANKINAKMDYYDDNVEIREINGQKCGVYIDDKKREHIVSNICPHLKCNLIFNYVDKTWDCPCHASQFDIDGNVLNGPSVYNIKIDK